MTLFLFEIDERSEKVVRFISRVRKELVKAVVSAKKDRNISQSHIAAKLDVNASVLSRQLSGEGNLTLRTVAELAWALDKEPFFELRQPEKRREINYTAETASEPASSHITDRATISCPMRRLESSGNVQAFIFENVI